MTAKATYRQINSAIISDLNSFMNLKMKNRHNTLKNIEMNLQPGLNS